MEPEIRSVVNYLPAILVDRSTIRTALFTLDGPLEEGLARLARGHAVVEARGDVAAHQAHPLRAAVLVLQRVLETNEEERFRGTGTINSFNFYMNRKHATIINFLTMLDTSFHYYE